MYQAQFTPMGLDQLSTQLAADPAFQQMRDEWLRRQQEEQQMAMLQQQPQEQPQISEMRQLLNQGYKPDTSREWGPGAVSLISPTGERTVASAAIPTNQTAELDQKYQDWKQKTLSDIIRYGAYNQLSPEKSAEQMQLYDQVAGSLSPAQKEARRIADQRTAADLEKARIMASGRTTAKPAAPDKWEMKTDSDGNMFFFNPVTTETKPATMGGKPIKGEVKGAAGSAKAATTSDFNDYVKTQAEAMQRQLAAVAGLDVSNYTPDQLEEYFGQKATKAKDAMGRVNEVAGVFESKLPAWATLNQTKEDVNVAIDSLREMSQKFGVQALRKAGVAPGSITEKEWSKFENDLATLKTSQSPQSLYNQLQGMYKQLNKAIAASQTDMSVQGGAASAPAQSVPTTKSGAERQAQLLKEANDAIAKGADPAKVEARLKQLLQGQ